MASKKLKIVCSVKVSRLEFVFLPVVDQLQRSFYKLPSVEQRITKLGRKSTMYQCCSVSLNFYLHTFVFNSSLVFNTLYLCN